LFATLGGRFAFITSSGYDPFSTNNSLPQSSIGVGRTVMAMDDFSTAVGAFWDWAPRIEAAARGAETSLGVHRLTLGLEGRYHLLRRLYVFARLAPGAVRTDATLSDRAADLEREAGAWVFAADLSGGAAFELAGESRGASNRPRFWATADGGYGWSASSSQLFEAPEGNPSPARLQPLDFGDIAIRGGFFRLAMALTY
jgi:hypothetical protein